MPLGIGIGVSPTLGGGGDAIAPTLAITMSDYALKSGDTATVTFTFSEEVKNFTVADVTAPNGSLSSFTVTANPKVYTVVFTPTAGTQDATNVITVGTSWSDLAGNPPAGSTNSSNYAVDTQAPTVAITSSASDPTATSPIPITITFSEEVTGFAVGDVTPTGGTLSGFATANNIVFTVNFTPTSKWSTVNVDVSAGVCTDLAGNSNTAATQFSIAYQPWLLRDDMNDTVAAGSVNGTAATPGPGTRVVTDTNTKISVGSGVLSFATGAVANDGLWLDAVTRAAGQFMVAKLVPSNTTGIVVAGWDSNQAGAINDALRLNATAGIGIVPNGGTAITVGAYTATTYNVAAVMRGTGIYWFIKGGAFTNWTLLYITAAGTGNGYPGIQAQNTVSIFTADNLRVPDVTWLPTPLAYDTFTRANGAIGNSETTGPDGQVVTARAWTGANATISSNKAIITPTLGSELLPNPGMEGTYDDESGGGGGTINVAPDWDNSGCETDGTDTLDKEVVIVHGGSASQKMVTNAVGEGIITATGILADIGWYQLTAWSYLNAGSSGMRLTETNGQLVTGNGVTEAWTQMIVTGRTTNPNRNIQVNAYTGPGVDGYVDDVSAKQITFSTCLASLTAANNNVLVAADLVVTAGTQAGVVVCLDSAASPANFLLAYHDGTKAKLDKCVAGTYTNLINTSAAYSASARLVVVKDGTAVSLYYNNVLIGTQQTVSDAGIVSNTLHGLFSTYSGNTLDNFAVWERGAGANYDTTLNRYIA